MLLLISKVNEGKLFPSLEALKNLQPPLFTYK